MRTVWNAASASACCPASAKRGDEARLDRVDTRLGALRRQGRFLATYLRDQRWSKAARGAQFCEVRMNADTGELRISRWLGVFDVGRVVNPRTAASQLRGSIVMGIGMALSEQTLVDPRNGRTMSAGLDSYYLPVHADIPPIDVAWLDEPDKTMPLGIIGLGEVGMTGVAAAIANAVASGTYRSAWTKRCNHASAAVTSTRFARRPPRAPAERGGTRVNHPECRAEATYTEI